jgi:hypothetical protein
LTAWAIELIAHWITGTVDRHQPPGYVLWINPEAIDAHGSRTWSMTLNE